MLGRLRPASLYPHRDRGTVLVPLWLPGLPARFPALGAQWQSMPEHHVTALAAGHVAERHGLAPGAVWAAVAQALEGRRAGPVRPSGELRLARDGEERTIVVMAHVDGLRAFWEDVAGRLGIAVPEPPTHITLASAPGADQGIGLHDAAMLAQLTRPLREDEAAEVRAALGV